MRVGKDSIIPSIMWMRPSFDPHYEMKIKLWKQSSYEKRKANKKKKGNE